MAIGENTPSHESEHTYRKAEDVNKGYEEGHSSHNCENPEGAYGYKVPEEVNNAYEEESSSHDYDKPEDAYKDPKEVSFAYRAKERVVEMWSRWKSNIFCLLAMGCGLLFVTSVIIAVILATHITFGGRVVLDSKLKQNGTMIMESSTPWKTTLYEEKNSALGTVTVIDSTPTYLPFTNNSVTTDTMPMVVTLGTATDINECNSNPCQHGRCMNKDGGYKCTCSPGWTGQNCRQDLDECTRNPCQHGHCVNQDGGYKCTCSPGWTGQSCQQDINECTRNPCQHGRCVNKDGGYKCTCSPGWTGQNCQQDINECNTNPCEHGRCVNKDGGYKCTCSPGWTGQNCSQVPSPGPGGNVALVKTAFQTSSREPASVAVDGNTNTNYNAGSCTHTVSDAGEENPTWWVDLGQSYVIDRLVIFNRQDCCAKRLNPFNIHIGDSDQVSENPKCGGDHHINLNQPSISVSCQGMKGRYVGVCLPGSCRILTLCEVQVFSAITVGYLQEITFPAPRSVNNYAKLGTTLAQDLTSFTLCLELRTDMISTSQAGVVSYAVQEHDNELLIFKKAGKGLELWVQNKIATLGDLPVWDGKRHAVCTTWRSTDGAWLVLVDGVRHASGSRLNVGGKVHSGGTWILAQDQDTVGGEFEPHQAFIGELSQVNLWDRVLTPAEIGTDSCRQHGNVIDWETTDVNVFGLATNAEYRCGDCQVGNGVSYRGTVAVTRTGKTCQRWDSQTPHGHHRTPGNHPSSGLEQNYCRNPDGEHGAWCYTTDPDTRWELCDVPVCAKRCQNGWTEHNSHCYKLMTDSVRGSAAPSKCSKYGAHLASITSRTENNFIKGLTSTSLDVCIGTTGVSIGGTGGFWIGLRKNGKSWSWLDGSRFGYTNWDSGEPNNSWRQILGPEECVVMYSQSGSNLINTEWWTGGTWHDKRCRKAYAYLCKKRKN